MSQHNTIRVFEFQKLKFKDDPKSFFNKGHFDAMVKFNESNGNKYYTVIHKGVQFNNYVGVINIGGLTIEILPKVDNEVNHTSEQEEIWQGVLLNMLKVCKKVEIDNISEASLKKRSNSLLDVYFEMYLSELEKLVNRGFIRKYRRVQGNQNTLKGQLLFSKNIQKNLVHRERFYSEHQVYDKNHLIHQILKQGLLVLNNVIDPKLKDRLNRLLVSFEGFKNLKVNENHFERINFTRNNSHYEKALGISKMLILNYSPDLVEGKDNMLTLLFDMNMLWEEYIYRILHKNKKDGYNVSFQNKKNFWERKTIRPDIVIKAKKETFIIDTKWKVIKYNNPSDNDLKQMFSYNLLWDSQKSMLLYPQLSQSDSNFGEYHYKHIKNGDNSCKLGFVKILENNKLRSDLEIANEVYSKLGI